MPPVVFSVIAEISLIDRFAFVMRGLAVVGLLVGAGCSDPYPTTSPRIVDPETGTAIAGLISFCYGTRINTPEDIKAAAAENCYGTLVFVEQDLLFNDCSVLQSARVTYQCRPFRMQGGVGRGLETKSEQ